VRVEPTGTETAAGDLAGRDAKGPDGKTAARLEGPLGQSIEAQLSIGLRAEDSPTLDTANDHVMQGAGKSEARPTKHTETISLLVSISQLLYDTTRRPRSIRPTRPYVPVPRW
jgi:hypothetical protein